MTTQEVAKPATSSAFLATGAMFCMVYSAIALLALHVLRPDYAPESNFISNYGVGPFGWVMTTWFLAQAVGTLLFAIGVARSGLRSITARIAISLMVIEVVGLVFSATFPTDLPGAPPTRAGHIHTISFLVNVASFLAVTLLLPISFGSHPGWRSFRPTAWALTGLIIVAFAIQFATLHKGMPYGLANRFFVIVALAWGLATAARLRAVLLSR